MAQLTRSTTPGKPQWDNSHPITWPPSLVDRDTGILLERRNDQDVLRWRKIRYQLLAARPDLQRVMLAHCRKSFRLWADLFAWTYKQLDVDEAGRQTARVGESVRQPVTLWPVHVALADSIDGAIRDGTDLVIPKSRDMMVTWVILLKILHSWLFVPNYTAMVVSRVEDLVDGHNPDSLFPRLRYVLKHLPGWMQPRDTIDTFKNLTNKAIDSNIYGTSTTEDAGVGGRKTLIFLDEAARNPHLREVWDATKDVSPTRIVLSTFRGSGMFRDLVFSGRRTFALGYWDHPLKGRGRQLRQDDAAGTYTSKPGSTFWWTPWIEHQVVVEKRSKLDIAQNILMDPDTGGGGIFDGDVLVRLIAQSQAFPPRHTGDLVHLKEYGAQRDESLRKGEPAPILFKPDSRGRVRLWCLLDKAGRPVHSGQCCIFADPSSGTGVANTAIAVGDLANRSILATVADPLMDPAKLSRYLAMLGYWFGTKDEPALVAWETNYSGGNILADMRVLEYPAVWHDPDTGNAGWTSNNEKKRNLLEQLRDHFARGAITCWDRDVFVEAGDYVVLPSGECLPERLREERDARAAHGDRVIAVGGCLRMMLHTTRKRSKPPAPIPGSLDYFFDRAAESIRSQRDD